MRTVVTVLLIIALCGSLSYAKDDKSQYRLQPTDVITITVHDQPDLTTKARVASDGYISFPLIGKVMAQGCSTQELEQKIKEALEKDYLVKAEVLIFIEQYRSRQFSVIGEVNKPGKFEMPTERTITLLEGIAMAGGFTKDADLTRTKVMRTEGGEKKSVDINIKDITEGNEKDKDVALQPDDVIFIPKSFFFSVTGEVKNPGKFNMPTERDITLLEGLAMAGGFTPSADLVRSKVMRIVNGVKTTIPVNIQDITTKGEKEKDIILKSDDLIFIPKRAFFSVIGEVKSPGKFDMPAERDITILEAIAMAGGFTKDASMDRVKIMRVEGAEKKNILVNVKDITEKDEKDKNVVLQSDDIVIVPESFF